MIMQLIYGCNGMGRARMMDKNKVQEINQRLKKLAATYPMDAYQEALDRIEELESRADWVSVDEQNPEPDTRCLLGHYYNGEWLWIASGIPQSDGGCWIDFDDDHFDSVVPNEKGHCHMETYTHHQPLPESPDE